MWPQLKTEQDGPDKQKLHPSHTSHIVNIIVQQDVIINTDTPSERHKTGYSYHSADIHATKSIYMQMQLCMRTVIKALSESSKLNMLQLLPVTFN